MVVLKYRDFHSFAREVLVKPGQEEKIKKSSESD
jgi:hypothetical protein